jgi:hypothetical protein
MARTHVILPDDLLDEIDKVVGERKRSEFLAVAAEKELKRRRLREIARVVGGSLRDADTPSEWNTPEGTLAWVRSLRESPDEQNVDSST